MSGFIWSKRLWLVGCTIVGVYTGVSLSEKPPREILYNPSTLPKICTEGRCTLTYTAQIGSTGELDPGAIDIIVRLPQEAETVLPPKLLNAGKSPVARELYEHNFETVLKVDQLDINSWLEFSITVSLPKELSPPKPTDVIEVRSNISPVNLGSPTSTRFARIISNYLDVF